MMGSVEMTAPPMARPELAGGRGRRAVVGVAQGDAAIPHSCRGLPLAAISWGFKDLNSIVLLSLLSFSVEVTVSPGLLNTLVMLFCTDTYFD
jgi:hypothetical protein